MSQFVELKKSDRKFEALDTQDKMLQELKENIKDLVLYIKFDIEKTVVQISRILDDKTIDVITSPGFLPEDNKMTVYGLLDKYFEMDLEVAEIKGPGVFRCSIITAKKATDVRKELRLKVTPEQAVATNFIISKHSIDLTSYNIPTSIKVLLEQFHTNNSQISDFFKVDVFEKADSILEKIRKEGKILFLKDISLIDSNISGNSNPDLYKPESEDIFDIQELFGDLLQEYVRKYFEKGYKSIIIAPINYITDAGSSIAFAYAQMISKGRVFSLEDVQKIKGLLVKLVERIKDANTILVQTEQQIVNLSRSGAKLYITDEKLKKYLRTTKGFVFNIVFKLQAPVTIYAEIKNVFLDDSGNLFVGIMFAGHSSRKDEIKRYNSFLDPIIKNYKDQLLKQRKKIQQKAGSQNK
jgi:hypothetical protein